MSDTVAFIYRVLLADVQAAYRARQDALYRARQDAFARSGRGVAAILEFERLDCAWREARAQLQACVRQMVRERAEAFTNRVPKMGGRICPANTMGYEG